MGLQEGRKGGVSPARSLAIAVSLVVAATVLGALWIAGSPAAERSRKIDNQRTSDLQNIAYAIDAYFMRTGAMPDSLETLASAEPEGYGLARTTDPVSGVQYEYMTKDGAAYALCATFDLPSEDDDLSSPRSMPYPVTSKEWSHPAGYHCFSMDSEVRTGRLACSLTNPCTAGQSCVTLPGKKGATCVPEGRECLAAGCAEDMCVIAESYPAQVSCTK